MTIAMPLHWDKATTKPNQLNLLFQTNYTNQSENHHVSIMEY